MLHTMSRQLAPAILLAAFTFNLPARAGDTVPIHGQGTLTGTWRVGRPGDRQLDHLGCA